MKTSAKPFGLAVGP